MKMKIAGTYGENGGFECFLAINGKYGASAMAQRCHCQPLEANERLCKCLIVCQE
ncbi:hypothetical protein PTKIN_Ptkin11bG0069800 [Pterospermum kingtungense]